MENVDGFSVERIGKDILLSFFDVFGQGEVYQLTIQDAKKIRDALDQFIGPK